MTRWPLALLLTCATAAFAANQPPPRLDGSRQSANSVDTLVQSLMEDEQVPGLGLALIAAGQVRYRKAYGLRNVAANQPLAPNTITDSPRLRPSVSSNPIRAVIPSTGITPASSIESRPGTGET